MNDVTQFLFQAPGSRVKNKHRWLEVDGKPAAIAKDIALALGYSNPAEAVRDHCKGVSETRTPTAGGMQTVKVIFEPDIYRLITASKLPFAQEFERQVFEEVLPSIRKHGGYISGQETMTAEQHTHHEQPRDRGSDQQGA